MFSRCTVFQVTTGTPFPCIFSAFNNFLTIFRLYPQPSFNVTYIYLFVLAPISATYCCIINHSKSPCFKVINLYLVRESVGWWFKSGLAGQLITLQLIQDGFDKASLGKKFSWKGQRAKWEQSQRNKGFSSPCLHDICENPIGQIHITEPRVRKGEHNIPWQSMWIRVSAKHWCIFAIVQGSNLYLLHKNNLEVFLLFQCSGIH